MSDTHSKRPVVAVHYCSDDAEADVIVSLLRDRGIESFTSPHNALPVTAGKLGEIQIFVDEKQAEAAITIIDEAGTPE